MADTRCVLDVLPGRFTACRLARGATVPDWALAAPVPLFLARTADEISIICEEGRVPPGIQAEHGFRALRVRGPLDWSLVGVLSSMLTPLAASGVSVLAVGTYDTDYLFVRASNLTTAIETLRVAGHTVLSVADSPT